MESPELIVLSLILLILAVALNMKAHAGVVLGAQDGGMGYCAEVWSGKKGDIFSMRAS